MARRMVCTEVVTYILPEGDPNKLTELQLQELMEDLNDEQPSPDEVGFEFFAVTERQYFIEEVPV